MVPPALRAQDIAASLTAAAYKPQVTWHSDHIRIETDVPESLSLRRWQALLAALERGDRFGLQRDAEGCLAWAAVFTGTSHRADDGSRLRRDTDSSQRAPATAPPPGGMANSLEELPT